MHKPVLLEETINNLVKDRKGVYVDGTLGGGGHLQRLMQELDPAARVFAFDKDKDIMEATKKKLPYPNITFIHADFRFMEERLFLYGIDKVDGIMLDLGVSSFQLDDPSRGFSFHEDARLDMRMNREEALSAWDIVNNYDEAEIARIIYEYGEERFARSIARAIVNSRKIKSIDTTLELVEVIKKAVPYAYKKEKHPARRTFQALRIAVNKELDALREVLPQAVRLLKTGGRLCIITFHSLEDRIVKDFMQREARECLCPPGMPVCVCGHKPQLKIVTRKPVVPSDEECSLNPRARSAKLRVAEKL
ncbi:16S rRNA (cytosine1402-N4)-methyltransferase [Thermosyntropha lipolytica DSM 11003]|uniref:Ribosomal RNA small subunit methyltransferase H n=1 Tax=Thermosyntropha lipolytica DSM 11003 TaxID=1123382 RepID=A0A1M5NZU1_9FIRM|nr:16S rRNA (cytosine(1402)-N(4))-methyltransferase RsmH [Thermosyntropha lipolytica]SHG94689.1 16S rRNA (cytosine1402-N4)-methyltransferase [Thermosyntropha lipolytica DSM 11003]